ncbi:DUF4282 domain-containing protein [Spirillospora sp. NPDC050679]
MTNPAEPGRPAQPPGSGPYGPPPPRQQQPQPHPQQHPGHVPGPRASGPGPQQRPEEWAPPARTDKGVMGALFDTSFEHLVTPKLIKVCYLLSLLLISLSALMVVAVGLWIAQLRDGWLLGLLVMCCAPVLWFFEAILARIFMEAVVVRFKGVEHLRVIKDKI